jgi:hypothetical protein
VSAIGLGVEVGFLDVEAGGVGRGKVKIVEDAGLGVGGVGAGGYNGEGGRCAGEEAAGWSEANAAGRWYCEGPGHG